MFGVNITNEKITNEETKELDAFDGWEIYRDGMKILILNVSNINCINEDINLFIKLLKTLKNLKYLALDDTNITSENLWLILEAWWSLESLRHISAIQKKYDTDNLYFSELK